MADDWSRPPVGSVAEEAARLLDALGAWAATAGYAGSSPSAGGPPPRRGGEAPAGHCPSCGAENGAGQAVVCALCPVCQGIGLLRAVRPETVDRLADLAAAVAETLHDLANQRRAAAGSPRGPGSGPARARVQDIPVHDAGAGVERGDAGVTP